MLKPNIILNKISKEQFLSQIKKRPFENLKNILTVEDFFFKIRGHVFKMPKPGTPVVVLVSGGLDSIITWGILLEKYKLRTYPLFIFRDAKRSKKEEKSVNYFTKYYSEKYPGLVSPLMKFSTLLSPPEIVKALKNTKNYYHPKRLLEIIDVERRALSDLPNFYPQRVLPFLHLFYCLVYMDYLYDHFLEKVTTVFTGIMRGDGIVVPSQTFTSMRNALLSACSVTANYDLQYCSLAMEKELGFWFDKSDFIKIGHQMGLPLEKTWTCYKSGKYQCGDSCLTCKNRVNSFVEAGVEDKTIYISTIKNRILGSLKFRLKKILVFFKLSNLIKNL